MSAVKGMPDHIDAGNDQYDNHNSVEIDDDKEIEIIKAALLDGDRFNTSGRHVVDFSDVVDDHLCCNAEFSNALRALMVGDAVKAVKDMREVVNKEASVVAESVYKYKKGL